jgi:hypothetical protein
MKCETCDREFAESAVKVWSGKKVCPACFQTLNGVHSDEAPSQPGREDRGPREEFPVDPDALSGDFVHRHIAAAQLSGLGTAVMAAAEDLGISLTREQVLRILANNNFPEHTKVATPLTSEERAVAVEVKYRWNKRLLERYERNNPGGAKHSDATIREIAAHEVYAAEIGRATGAGQLAHKLGCSVVLALVSACAMTIAAVLVAVVIVRGY